MMSVIKVLVSGSIKMLTISKCVEMDGPKIPGRLSVAVIITDDRPLSLFISNSAAELAPSQPHNCSGSIDTYTSSL